MKNILFLLLILSSLAGCRGRKNDPGENILPAGQPRVFDIRTDETGFEKIGERIEMDRYLLLPPEPLLGDIRRILIQNDRIYLLDDTPQLVCYDLQGQMQYRIASRGGGPDEFGYLLDFCIDSADNRIIAYDNQKGYLMRYDLHTGRYLSKKRFDEIFARHVAYADGLFLYDNATHSGNPDRKDLHYHLLYSSGGSKIDKRFFPHGAAAEYDFDAGHGHPFFYNGDRLLYNNRFDKTVYAIEPEGPRPVYEINLPNPVPERIIEQKTDPMELMISDYSSGMTGIFECNDILYFWFTRQGRVYSAFYHIPTGEPVYCGYRLDIPPTEKLMFLSLMRGVYRDRFFSVVDPEAIIYQKKNNPDLFPADLANLTEADNPVIAFYRVTPWPAGVSEK